MRPIRDVHSYANPGETRVAHAALDLEVLFRERILRGSVDLLPRWDAYTMAYAPDGRRRFVHPNVQAAVYTPIGVGLAGDGNPVVLVDGEAVATWTFSLKDGADVQPFDTLGPKVRRRVDAKLDEIASLLGGSG